MNRWPLRDPYVKVGGNLNGNVAQKLRTAGTLGWIGEWFEEVASSVRYVFLGDSLCTQTRLEHTDARPKSGLGVLIIMKLVEGTGSYGPSHQRQAVGRSVSLRPTNSLSRFFSTLGNHYVTGRALLIQSIHRRVQHNASQ